MQYTRVRETARINEDTSMKDVSTFEALQKPPTVIEPPVSRQIKVLLKVNVVTSDYDLTSTPTEGDTVTLTTVTLTRDGKLVIPKFSAAGAFYQIII